MPKSSVAGAARTAKAADRKLRAGYEKARTSDSFQNFAAQLGIGADTLLSASTYGFNPITRIRTILEWIHRGTWLGGVAIDIVADDMTKMGVELRGDVAPEDIQHLDRAATTWNLWGEINDTIKWARLYGGCIAVMMIDGQDTSTPLNLDRIGKQAFKGLLVLDRWMVEPSLNDLIRDPGPDMGNPKFYSVIADAPAIPRMKVHYSRCIRLEGIRLPYWQRLTENLWGISIIERLYDRMVAFDSATTGMSQLIFKAYLRTYKIKGFRDIIAAGGSALSGLVRQLDFMRRTQSSEGITLLDMEDEFATFQHSAFGGLAECQIQLAQQIAGSLQIPLVRLFGQSPTGMNSTGESDLRTYYDGIKMQQEKTLRVPVTRVYRALAASEGIKLDEGFSLEFRPLWILDDVQKIAAAAQLASAVGDSFDRGIISRKTALEELKQSSKITGVYTNISDEEIAAAELEPAPALQAMEDRQMQQEQIEQESAGGGKTKDAMLGDRKINGFNVVVEQEKNDERYGRRLPAAYGCIRRTGSAEGKDEQMDCFVGPDKDSPKIFIVDSFDQDGRFDEHKVMFHYVAEAAALRDFSRYYFDRRAFIAEVSSTALSLWLQVGELTRPFTQPTDVQFTVAAHNPKEVCGNCIYFQTPFCTNQKTARDPHVPEMMGNKVVASPNWCKEFESKETPQ